MNVLITGATGLIGTELVHLCKKQGYSVHYFTRSRDLIQDQANYKGFYWDPSNEEIDLSAFEGVTSIIHLAGATVAQRWTTGAKADILGSRVQPANLIYNSLQKIDHSITQFITASGIGIYPNSETKLYEEEDAEINDTFLAKVVVAWEEAANQFKDLGMKVAILRTGMVLSKNGGVLSKMLPLIKLGIGSPLGSGKQWQSWIHIDDVVAMYCFVLKENLEGVFNTVAPNPVTNKNLTKKLAAHVNAPLWLPNVPAFVLKGMLGEMSELVLEGQLVSARKIEERGFVFNYSDLDAALYDLI